MMQKVSDRPVWRGLSTLMKWLCALLAGGGYVGSRLMSAGFMASKPFWPLLLIMALPTALVVWWFCARRASRAKYWGVDVLIGLLLLLCILWFVAGQLPHPSGNDLLDTLSAPYFVCFILLWYPCMLLPLPVGLLIGGVIVICWKHYWREQHEAAQK